MRARSGTTADAELLASAVALRWARPDLTAAVAEHVASVWEADDRTWVAAAGWLVHGRAAVGDGRECASDTLAELVGRDPDLLDDPAADRLRIEVAALAAAQCEPAAARLLVEPLIGDRPAVVRADALGVLARCAFEGRPAAVGEVTRRAAAAWGLVRGVDADIAVAALTLLSAAAARRAGHPDTAVEHAAEGLARLDDLRPGASAPHLSAALAAEWITALIEGGRVDDARDGSAAMAHHLGATTRPTRQTALLRLAVARALAGSKSAGAVAALEQAATDAAQCDTPDLEGLCLSTLGTLREQAGRLDAALESMRRGVAAQRRDRARSERFRAALGALPLRSPGALVTARSALAMTSHAHGACTRRVTEGLGAPHPLADRFSDPWTTGRWTYAAHRLDGGRRRVVVASAPGRGSAVDVPDVGAPGSDGETDVRPVLDEGAGREFAGDGGFSGQVADDVFDPLFGPLERIVEKTPDDEAVAAWEPEATAASDSGEAAAPLTYDGESWLATALAEGAPDRTGCTGLDQQTVRPWAEWTEWTDGDVEHPPYGEAAGGGRTAEEGSVADDAPGGPDALGPPSVGAEPGPDTLGCVVVVDVVCAGESVTEGVALLRGVRQRLTDRIPPGARLRLDKGGSVLSIVLPGQERTIAADWMHRTLPAVFHGAGKPAEILPLPVGTALRATVHDTDGPVGAQLLQRLDLVRARQGDAPPVPVRWGVSIAPGSGGRRRRVEAPGPVAGRPDHPADEPPGGAPADASPTSDATGRAVRRGRHRKGSGAPPANDVGAASVGGPKSTRAGGVELADDDRPPSAGGASSRAGQAQTAGDDASSRAGEAQTAGDDAELSVEGLGLAELLAGALAAYRAI